MRFRTELRVVLPVVLAAAGVPAIEGCKKEPTTLMDAGAGKPPIVIKNNGDIPVMLGGAVAPYHPPPIAADGGGGAAPPLGRNAPSPGAQAQAAPAAVAPATNDSAVAILHNHPPDQPYQPLKREEVATLGALGDLRQREKKP